MKRSALVAIALLALCGPGAGAQLPVEARSHITVLVDLSGTWLDNKSRTANRHELEVVATTIAALVPTLKAPVEVQYFEIGDASFSRAPLCSARFSPSIFPSMATGAEFSDLKKLIEYFGEDCTRLILMKSPAKFTDITGALNTVARIASLRDSLYSGLIVLSDFQEERRRSQTGDIGSLRGMHVLLLYRVLEADRLDPARLDSRISAWQARLHRAGASVRALDDVFLEPAQMKRLLTK